MAARSYSQHADRKATAPKGGGMPRMKAGKAEAMPMRSPSWPGLPGGTQPRDRSGGVPRSGNRGAGFNVNAKGF